MRVLILRDPRESAAKCSLTPLRGTDGVRFVDYHPERRVNAAGHILLHADGDELTPRDAPLAEAGVFLIDSSWRKVAKLLRRVDGDPVRRRLPALETAYPRKSKTFDDPGEGLASIEALYAALAILGDPRPDLLASYRWREEFLKRNPRLPE